MPSRFSRMTWPQRLAWAKQELFLRRFYGFNAELWRQREQDVGATTSQANRAIRRHLKLNQGTQP